MQYKIEINNDINQSFEYLLDNGETIKFNLYYCIRVYTFFLDVEYKDIRINNIKVVLSNNLLIQYENILPFKLLVIGRRPFLRDDFLNENTALIIEENV